MKCGFEKKSKKRTRKYFIGGLLKKAASITPLGMGIKALKGGKDDEQQSGEAQQGGGKILKVKVIGEEGGGQKIDKAQAEALRAKKDAGAAGSGDQKTSGAAVMKKGGVLRKKKRHVKQGKTTGNTNGLFRSIYKK